ncbi:MAG: Flp family type IVb pilin [Nitrospirales bacterium]
MNNITTFINDEQGATALEYGLLAALIGAVILGAVQTMGNVISTTFNTISSNMTAAS